MKLTIVSIEIASAVAALLTRKGFTTTAENIEFKVDEDGVVTALAEVPGGLLDEPKEVKTRKPRTPKAVKTEVEADTNGDAPVADPEPTTEVAAEAPVAEAPKKKLFGSKPAESA